MKVSDLKTVMCIIKKIHNAIPKNLFVVLILILLSGCATTVKFAYNNAGQQTIEKKVDSSASIYMSMFDSRTEPDIIGHTHDFLELKVKDVKTKEPDVAKSILPKYKSEFSKMGFVVSNENKTNDLKLNLTITTFQAEMKAGMVDIITKADCCMNVSLISGKGNGEIYKTSICGKGEKTSGLVAGKKDFSVALSFALDDVLNKLLNDDNLSKLIDESKQ